MDSANASCSVVDRLVAQAFASFLYIYFFCIFVYLFVFGLTIFKLDSDWMDSAKSSC